MTPNAQTRAMHSADTSCALAIARIAEARAINRASILTPLAVDALLGEALESIRDAHGALGDLYALTLNTPHQ